MDCKEIQPVYPKGDQSWAFIGRTDVEAETPMLWSPDAKSGLIWKDPDAGRDWGQEEKETTEDEMAGWHHWLNGHGSGWTPGVGDGHGGLVCYSSWGRKESDTTEWLNWLILWKMDEMTTLPSEPHIWCESNPEFLLGVRILKNMDLSHRSPSSIPLSEALCVPFLQVKTPLRECFNDFYSKWKKKIKGAIAKLGYLVFNVSFLAIR